ncbi:MAG TPA: DUF2905 domain-containing protein [Actinoallomurus sp.]|jgi:uncharacterized protein HemY
MGRTVGPWLIGSGAMLLIVGLLAWSGGLSWFGRLPGDIRIETERTHIFIPITSMLIVSAGLNLLLYLFLFLFRH